MMEKKALTLLSSVLVALAACASAGEDDGSTTTATDATTTTVPRATTTTAPPESTTSTAAESTTTTTAPESSGDLSLVHAAIGKTVEAVPPFTEGTVTIGGIEEGFVASEIDMTFFMTTDAATGDSAMVMAVEDAAEMAGEEMFEEVPAELTDMIGELETREIGGTMYIRSLNLIAIFGAETVWVSMPAAASDGLTGGLGPDAAPDSNTGLLESFSDAKGTVETLGEEDVRGIATTHYRLLFEDGWIESLPENRDIGTAEPLEVWIDNDGFVRRLFFQAGLSESADTPFLVESVSWAYEFFDFGESVTIKPPPADQVTDIEDLMGGFSGFDS